MCSLLLPCQFVFHSLKFHFISQWFCFYSVSFFLHFNSVQFSSVQFEIWMVECKERIIVWPLRLVATTIQTMCVCILFVYLFSAFMRARVYFRNSNGLSGSEDIGCMRFCRYSTYAKYFYVWLYGIDDIVDGKWMRFKCSKQTVYTGLLMQNQAYERKYSVPMFVELAKWASNTN